MEPLINANEHLGLVYGVANSWKRRLKQVDVDDLVCEGTIGLMRAVKKFDPSRGVKFTTFATFWIRAQVWEYLAMRADVVHVPQRRVRRGLARAQVRSLDAPVEDGNEEAESLHELLADQAALPADQAYAKAERSRRLAKAFAVLDSRERAILRGRYLHDLNFERIAPTLGISRERVRVLHNRAIAKLLEEMSQHEAAA